MEETKKCSKCGKDIPINEFPKNKRQNIFRCRECFNAYFREWNKKNPIKSNEIYKKYRHDGMLKHKYGITANDYNRMFTEQEGRCVICGKHQSEMKQRLAVDHDHITGKVRSLLCHQCNLIIGHAHDDISILYSAIDYLEKH